MADKKTYILFTRAWNKYVGHGYQWLLLSHTGLVMARSDFYRRRCDATRVGKRVARKLGIDFKEEQK